MPRPQDIQDLMDHAVTVAGVHGISDSAVAGGVPKANASGKISDSWLSDKIARVKPDGTIDVIQMPPEVVLTVNGKIPNGLLPDSIVATTVTASSFKLSNGTDLLTYINNKVPGATNTNITNCNNCDLNCGTTLIDAALSATASSINLTRTYRADCNCNCNCNCGN